ncbi:ion channel [Pseudoalteromonas sp.]|uniref:ion channel n=1 Tax=Pseudoalteromonas sp. TaxID=53249 RepID=UPI003565D495
MSQAPKCHYVSPDNEQCCELDMGGGYCFWHDQKYDKSGLVLTEKLERYAHRGGLLKGLQLKRADLTGLNLVNHQGKHFDLSYSNFYRANMQNAHLYNTCIRDASLMKADLRDSNLHCAKLERTNLLGMKLAGARIDNMKLGQVLLQEELARKAEKQKDHESALDYFEQSEEIYRDLRNAAENQGLLEVSGKFNHKVLIMRRHQYPKWSRHRIASKFFDILCGYGERPVNVIFFSMMLIVLCALGYFTFGVSYHDQTVQFNPAHSLKDNMMALGNSLYFSVVTFTTLGYGDITPLGYSRLIAAVEAFCGSFSLALFVVVFVKKMTR